MPALEAGTLRLAWHSGFGGSAAPAAPPPDELLDERPWRAAGGPECDDEPTVPPDGLISHHLAPNWSLPWPLVLPAPVSPA